MAPDTDLDRLIQDRRQEILALARQRGAWDMPVPLSEPDWPVPEDRVQETTHH